MANPNSDFEEHEKTYQGFVKATKYSVIATAIFMVFLYLVVNP